MGRDQAFRGEQAGRACGVASSAGEEFRFSGTFQKRRRSGAGGPASPALVWEPFRKIKLRKETSGAETLQSNPYSLSWQLKTASKKKQRRKKKKSCMHSRKLTAFF